MESSCNLLKSVPLFFGLFQFCFNSLLFYLCFLLDRINTLSQKLLCAGAFLSRLGKRDFRVRAKSKEFAFAVQIASHAPIALAIRHNKQIKAIAIKMRAWRRIIAFLD